MSSLAKQPSQKIPIPSTTNKNKPETWWDKYFREQEPKRMNEVKKLALQDTYTVEKLDGNFETLTRKKVSIFDVKEIEVERQKFQKITEADSAKIVDAMIDIYGVTLSAYFGKQKEELRQYEWNDIKKVLDACTFRSLYGVPNVEEDSVPSSSMDQPA